MTTQTASLAAFLALSGCAWELRSKQTGLTALETAMNATEVARAGEKQEDRIRETGTGATMDLDAEESIQEERLSVFTRRLERRLDDYAASLRRPECHCPLGPAYLTPRK